MALYALVSQTSLLHLSCVFLLVSRVLGQTISIGTNFITSTASASSAQLTGLSCALHSYPNGDVGLDLSNGLRDQIQSIKSSSTNSTSIDFKIQQAIIAANYNIIQKKQLESAALAEGAFILGTIAYLFSSRPDVPIHIQIPDDDVAQIKSAQAVYTNPTVMYIKTASVGPVATVPLADSSAVAPSVVVSSVASCPSQILRCETVECGGEFPKDVCEQPGRKGCKCGSTVQDPIAEPPFDANVWTSGVDSWAQILSSLSTMGPAPTAPPSCTLLAPGSNNNPCGGQACYCPSGGGVIVPPLTRLISGTATTDCSYTTIPSIDDCPPAPLPATSAPSSSTLATSTTTAVSPTIGPVVCNTYETSYSKCWTDISPDEVNTTANWMIGHQLPNGPMVSGSPNITEVLTKHGLNYFMNIGWLDGCNMVDSQGPANPIADDPSVATSDILWEIYANCRVNNGIGGYSSTGCLEIGFFPNKVAGVSGNPPTPANYWKNPVYC